jgi:hypothetical protein
MIEIILVAVVFYGGGHLLIKWLDNRYNEKGSLLYPIEKESDSVPDENHSIQRKTSTQTFNNDDYLGILNLLKSNSDINLPKIELLEFNPTNIKNEIRSFYENSIEHGMNDPELLNIIRDILTQSNSNLNIHFWENNLYILHKIALNFKDYGAAKYFAKLIYSIFPDSTYTYQAYGEAALYDALKFKQSIGDSLMFDYLGMRYIFSFPDAITHFIKQIEVNHEYKEEKETFYKVKSLILLSIALHKSSIMLHKIDNSEYSNISKTLFDIAKSQATKALPLELGFGNLPFNDEEYIYSSWDVVENTWLK